MDRGFHADQFSWADDVEPDTPEFTIAFVRPAVSSVDGLFRVVESIAPAMTVMRAVEEIDRFDDFAWGSELLQVDSLADWTVFIQPYGWGTSLPEVVAHLSRPGEAVSVYWCNATANMSLCLARSGNVVRYLDPLLYDDTDPRLPEESDLPLGDVARPRSSALALAARLTGVAVTPEWLYSRARPTFRVGVPRDIDNA